MADWFFWCAAFYTGVGATSFVIFLFELLWTIDEPHWGRVLRTILFIALGCVCWPLVIACVVWYHWSSRR